MRTEAESSDMAGEEEVEQLEEREEELEDGFLKASRFGLRFCFSRDTEVWQEKDLGREKGIG